MRFGYSHKRRTGRDDEDETCCVMFGASSRADCVYIYIIPSRCNSKCLVQPPQNPHNRLITREHYSTRQLQNSLFIWQSKTFRGTYHKAGESRRCPCPETCDSFLGIYSKCAMERISVLCAGLQCLHTCFHNTEMPYGSVTRVAEGR